MKGNQELQTKVKYFIDRMGLKNRNGFNRYRSSNQSSRNITNNKLALPSNDGLDLIPFSEIIKCQADRSYCRFHLASGEKILVSKSMKEYEDLLIAHDFLKVHRSTIVNISFVEKYINGKGGQLIMADGSMVMVSVRKKDELMQILKASWDFDKMLVLSARYYIEIIKNTTFTIKVASFILGISLIEPI